MKTVHHATVSRFSCTGRIPVVLFVVVVVSSFPCWGAEAPPGAGGVYDAMVKRQPFMPKAGPVAVAKSGVGGSYRFTGFVILGERVRAGIENVAQNKSYLLAAGESQEELTLKEVDPKEKRVVVTVGSETFRLDLTEPSATAPAVTPQPPPSASVGGGAPPSAEPQEGARRRIIVPLRR